MRLVWCIVTVVGGFGHSGLQVMSRSRMKDISMMMRMNLQGEIFFC